jgi:hypothetical protein
MPGTLAGLMRPTADHIRVDRRRRSWSWPLIALLTLAPCAGCPAGSPSAHGLAVPADSVAPSPSYPEVCAPIGVDVSNVCLRLTLGAIDAARAREGVRPMRLPSDLGRLGVAEQLFVVVDRGLPPFAALSVRLNTAARAAAAAARLPARPGREFARSDAEWLGAAANGLDADYRWMYADGPGSGIGGCARAGEPGCWADRGIVLDRLGVRDLVMGAAYDPTADPSPGDRAGPSLAATFAAGRHRTGSYDFTWADAQAAMAAGTLRPLRSVPSTESNTGIADPARNVAPTPDFTRSCADEGIDDSARCIGAVLDAVNHAHALEGIGPMVLPSDFGQLSVPQQLLVAIDLERVDRHLPPFAGLTGALDANAQRGADTADDPPDPGRAYLLDDAEWAGGSANGLDAVYGWMYDDGFDSGNLDCLHPRAPGCWGHRKGILDNFGSGSRLAMGAALDASGDTHRGDGGGTSMAVTLAVAQDPAPVFTYLWSQAVAAQGRATG